MKAIKAMFPRASQSFIAANPENPVQANVERLKAKPRTMTKPEVQFAAILEAMRRHGEILRWDYEGVTLRFAGVRYTPDFIVFHQAYIKLVEVKGPFIGGNRERAVERFRHAKTYWPQFVFELHQLTKDGWRQLV